MTEHNNIFLAIVAAALFGLIGIASIFWPHKIRAFYRKEFDRPETPQFLSPVKKYMDKPFYITKLRITGIMALAASIYIILGLLGLFRK